MSVCMSAFCHALSGKTRKGGREKVENAPHLRKTLLAAYLIRIHNKRRPLRLGPHAHVNTATFAAGACLIVPVYGGRFDLS
jgi:hypothetical protein